MNQQIPDDGVLIQRISRNDLGAFKELVNRYRIVVYNTCYGMLGDHHHAEDATQDIFLQIYKSAGSFRGKSKVSTWIYRISVNRSLNVIRRNKRSRWMMSLNSVWKDTGEREEVLPASSRDEPDKRFEKKQIKDFLKKSVDSLSDKQRAAFVLSKYENLTSKEISDILGISINSVEARIHRAKLNLQKKLVNLLSKKPGKP
ncbi:MAG: RNA polymerase sigma factor [Candidatus Aminicenantes bacterium]|nr:RNA polymerase sigma factor [Candidatus Aminicenantes bacterium]